MTPDMEEAMNLPEDYETASVGQAPSYTVTEEVFDFELFLAGLSETMIPRKSITQDVRESIKKLSYLYGIDPISMRNTSL